MLFTHNEPQTPGVVEVMSDVTQRPAPSAIEGRSYREMESSVELEHLEHPEHEELLTLNLGPHHPPRTACCA